MKFITVYLFLFLSSCVLLAQKVQEPKSMSDDWSKPYEPFNIVGNVYYVGTYDLACYLITSSQGHILINTGLATSAPMIEANVKALGFNFSDIKILLTTQAHWDHCGALAQIKAKTGAKMMINEKDAQSLEDGGSSDYAFGGNGSTYAPVKVDRLLRPDDIISIGDVRIKMLHHPGHTKGSCSYLLSAKDDKRSYEVLIANMPTIVVDTKLSEVKAYPTISEDLAITFESMKNLSFDIWLASHANQFKMHRKRKPGDAYNPTVFIDRAGYEAALEGLQRQYEAKK
jgi:metallo-beta-lactamase class B